MTKQNKLNFYIIYRILLSISIVVAGICLICGSLYIYFSGDGYSRKIVINTFAKISIPIYVCIALIIGSFFVGDKSRSKFYKPKNFNQTKEPVLDFKKLYIVKVVIIIVAITALIFGALAGGFADVLTKAVNICTECIGLG